MNEQVLREGGGCRISIYRILLKEIHRGKGFRESREKRRVSDGNTWV